MSLLYRVQPWLTVAQLVPAWARELAEATPSACGSQIDSDLRRYLYEDAVNGILDAAGPLRSGRRLGLAIIGPGDDQAHYVEGRLLGCVLIRQGKTRSPFFSLPDRILITKEAVLYFARSRELPPPSWWAETANVSKERPGDTGAKGAAKGRKKRGRKPIKLERVKEAMRRDIREGRQTASGLDGMLQKRLAVTYGVSRDTACNALAAVLLEFVGNSNPDKSSTNDK